MLTNEIKEWNCYNKLSVNGKKFLNGELNILHYSPRWASRKAPLIYFCTDECKRRNRVMVYDPLLNHTCWTGNSVPVMVDLVESFGTEYRWFNPNSKSVSYVV